MADYDPDRQAGYVAEHGEDPGLWCYAYLAWAEDWLGARDRALMWKDKGVALARRLPNGYSKSFTMGLAAQLHRWRREPEPALAYAREGVEIAENQGVSQFHAWSSILSGWAQAALGELDDGLTQAEAGFDRWRSLGLVHVQWRHLILLAEIHRLRDEPDQALKRLEEAEAGLAQDNHGLGVVELIVTKGEVQLDLGLREQGEATLRSAIAIAREQRTRTFELRGALALARSWSAQGRRAEAACVLSHIHTQCDQGANTPLMQDADALLSELAEI